MIQITFEYNSHFKRCCSHYGVTFFLDMLHLDIDEVIDPKYHFNSYISKSILLYKLIFFHEYIQNDQDKGLIFQLHFRGFPPIFLSQGKIFLDNEFPILKD